LTILHKRKVGTGEIEAAAKKNVFGEDAIRAGRCKRMEYGKLALTEIREKDTPKSVQPVFRQL
jgi:hypothetical protein